MPDLRAPILLVLSVALVGCASSGAVRSDATLDEVGEALAADRLEEAALVAEAILDDSSRGPLDRAEAAFLAGEARMQLAEHLRAYRHYRYVLENAPWSAHAATIERRLYDIGLAFLRDEKYGGWFDSRGRGIDALETLQAHFVRSDLADDALRLIGDYFSDPEIGEWQYAAETYERLVEEYPESEWVERALWRAAESRLAMAWGPDYDRSDLLRARRSFERSLELYPRGIAAAESRAGLERTIEQLALREVAVADFYRSRGQERGEVVRLLTAALLYPSTEAGAEAMERLVALGIDVDAARSDPALNATDNVIPSNPPWAADA